jgi:hypothetical protein
MCRLGRTLRDKSSGIEILITEDFAKSESSVLGKELPEESGPMSIQKQKPKKVVVDTS